MLNRLMGYFGGVTTIEAALELARRADETFHESGFSEARNSWEKIITFVRTKKKGGVPVEAVTNLIRLGGGIVDYPDLLKLAFLRDQQPLFTSDEVTKMIAQWIQSPYGHHEWDDIERLAAYRSEQPLATDDERALYVRRRLQAKFDGLSPSWKQAFALASSLNNREAKTALVKAFLYKGTLEELESLSDAVMALKMGHETFVGALEQCVKMKDYARACAIVRIKTFNLSSKHLGDAVMAAFEPARLDEVAKVIENKKAVDQPVRTPQSATPAATAAPTQRQSESVSEVAAT